MTKHDFAIHLFTQARTITSGQTQRVPVVAMIVLLVLTKRSGEWMTGTELAAGAPTLSSNIIISSTRQAVEAGYLERRPYAGGVNGAFEYRATNAGLRLVHQLLSTDPVPA